MDGFTWLRHPASGGTFRCPDAAVDEWCKNGWEPGEAPEEVNPAVVDRLALEREQQTAAEAAESTKPTKAARRGESQEMSNG